MTLRVIALLWLAFAFLPLLSAQQRFKAGFTAGLNASQIQGDDTGGYNKLGLVGGLKGIAVLGERSELSLELTYSQRGSKNDKAEPVDIVIRLAYAEVPVLFNYKDWYVEDGDYHRVMGSIGFSYGRLLSAESEGLTSKYIDETDNFTKDDFSFVVGAEFFFQPRLSLGIRWNSSFNKLFHNDHAPGKNELRGYFLSFRLNYLL